MGRKLDGRLHWEDGFIAALAQFGNISRACKAAGITKSPIYARRKRSEEFRRRWDEAERAAGVLREKNARKGKIAARLQDWQGDFLEALAETSNVSASAMRANVSPREVYARRRDDRPFAAKWRAALYEGYCNLEMEVLGFLRDPAPKRKMDVANALRLLAAHKEEIAKEGAQRANVSAAEVRASIERKVEALRRQVAARKAREAARKPGSQ